MSNLHDEAAAGIPIHYLVPSGSLVDVAMQSAAEVEDLLTVSAPKPVMRFEDPPESVDDPNLEVDDGKIIILLERLMVVMHYAI